MSQGMDRADLSYLDFELEIGPGRGREYPVTVFRSPAGEARETMRFPYDELALESRLKDTQIALLSSGGGRRQVLPPEEQAVQDFGQALFDALLTGEVRNRYEVSLREAARKGKGLRLKLRIQPPELVALPWEFLYDSRQAEYVSLSRSTPIVRYLSLPQPIQPFAVAPPLRMLGMIASPRDLPALDVAREKHRMEKATRDLQAQGLLELTWLEGQTWRDLQRAMREGPWHVFHFIGHGGFDRVADEGFIALVDEEGETESLRATQLGRLLADHRSLRLVLLNACEGARGGGRDIFSSTASILVRRGIPAVLAMQYEISDRAAIEFASAFYEAMADGMPVDGAVAEARKAINLAMINSVEWGAPVLHMRSPDGLLFDIQRKALEPQPGSITLSPRPEAPGPSGAQRWLRSLPPLAWAGLLVLLLLVGMSGVALGGGDQKLSRAPVITVVQETLVESATPTSRTTEALARIPAAMNTPTVPATKTLTPGGTTPVPGASEPQETCLAQYFADITQDRQVSIEVGDRAKDYYFSSPDSLSNEVIGPLGVRLTQFGGMVGALQFVLLPDDVLFKVKSVVDSECQGVNELSNMTRGGSGDTLQNWDALMFQLPDGSFALRFGLYGDHIRFSFRDAP